MSGVEFVERLPVTDTKWAPIAAELRSRPGVWAVISDTRSVGGDGYRIKTGKLRAFLPAGSFEAEVRRGKLYARYVGEAS